jgi:hypothetical protein
MLQITEFNLSYIYENANILIIGKTNCGKSWLVKDILFELKDIKNVQVISDSEFYSKFIGTENIYATYNETIYDNIYADKNKKILIMEENQNQNKNIFSKLIIKKFLNSTNNSLTNIVITEDYNINNEEIKKFDYIFLFDNSLLNYKKFCNFFSHKYLSKIAVNLLNDYGCVVVDNITKMLYSYKSRNLSLEKFFIKTKDELIIENSNHEIEFDQPEINHNKQNKFHTLFNIGNSNLATEYVNFDQENNSIEKDKCILKEETCCSKSNEQINKMIYDLRPYDTLVKIPKTNFHLDKLDRNFNSMNISNSNFSSENTIQNHLNFPINPFNRCDCCDAIYEKKSYVNNKIPVNTSAFDSIGIEANCNYSSFETKNINFFESNLKEDIGEECENININIKVTKKKSKMMNINIVIE